MLINFSLENWASFRDCMTFSMIASRERQHRERVPLAAKYQTRILPIAAIYGDNCFRKDKFVQGIELCHRRSGSQPSLTFDKALVGRISGELHSGEPISTAVHNP